MSSGAPFGTGLRAVSRLWRGFPMTDLRSRVIRLAHTQPELRPALLPLLKEAGALVPMVTVYLSVIPRKLNTPFNSDHLFGLEKVYVSVKGGGSVGVTPLDAQRSKGRFTWAQEKAGYKNETVVEVQIPSAAAARALAGIRAVLAADFTVRLLPARRLPEDQIPAEAAPRPFPSLREQLDADLASRGR